MTTLMRPLGAGAAVAALVAAGAVVKKVTAHHTADGGARWLAVTVNAPADQLTDRVAELGAGVETRLTPAPGGRGTEVAARSSPDGEASASDLRRALRELKSVVETGEVVRPDEPTTGRPTPGGALMRAITRRAGGEGRL